LKNYHSYSEIRSDLDLGIVSCEDIVNHHLAVIQAKNPLINAFLEVFSVEALLQAKAIDKKIKNGSAGRLAGLVVGIKDLFCFSGHQLTCASKILEGFESQITATCIERLLTEDAIVIGRQNCDEFAMGSSNENSAYGITRNPIDESTVPGGSSGASAAAVAADMCQVSIGSDTGGSVRQPASFCGIVGLKPTYSRISRYGLTAYASSFDCVGVLSKSVEDAQLVLDVMAGHDPRDSTSSKKPAKSKQKNCFLQRAFQCKRLYAGNKGIFFKF
jgi:aspartyl-tRNA(Asn)/glutamyl-tRNA(Gln) amidotransferase subunit A